MCSVMGSPLVTVAYVALNSPRFNAEIDTKSDMNTIILTPTLMCDCNQVLLGQ